MGSSWSRRSAEEEESGAGESRSERRRVARRRAKRTSASKWAGGNEEEEEDDETRELSPKRYSPSLPQLGGAGLRFPVSSLPFSRRIQATSSYIFETMFRRGTDSDITINALGEHNLSRSGKEEGYVQLCLPLSSPPPSPQCRQAVEAA